MRKLTTLLFLVGWAQACRGSGSNEKAPPAAAQTVALPPPAAPDTLAPEVAAMRKTLRDLITAEETYFAVNSKYTKSLRVLAHDITPAPGVTVTVDSIAGESWRARATDRAAPGWTCGIYVLPSRGGAGVAPYLPGQKEAVARCWKAQT